MRNNKNVQLNKSFIERAYEPYLQLTLHCFCKDIIICVLCNAALLVFGAHVIIPELFLWIPVFLVAECFFVYKVALLGLIEKMLKKVETEKLTLIKMRPEYDASARFGNSVMDKLYPEKMMVNRYKIICKNDKGRQCIIRFAGSRKKMQLINDIIQKNTATVCVTYGKLSKVAFFFEGRHDINSMF